MFMKKRCQSLVKTSREEQMKDADFAKAHEEMSPFWDLQRELVSRRVIARMTQKELATRIGVKQSQISRFENSSYENCTVSTLIAYAKAVGMKELLINLK